MTEILVTQRNDRYEVTVTDGAGVTQHEVRVTPSDLSQLGLDGCDVCSVVEESFRFLLEHEPKESILATFDLPTIMRFFPTYPGEIRRRLAH